MIINQFNRLRKKIYSIWLFHTNRGQLYIKENASADGFDSIWQRFMKKTLEKTALINRFTEHDLRAKVASDTESEHARQLLGHATQEITDRVYRRKAEVVRPTK
jgi:integrase